MVEDTPDLSVIIPAYNAQETIEQQLDAFARQRSSVVFEVLVCNNGSTDRTVEIVRSRQTREPWLRLVDASAKRGPAAARNIGVQASRAALIAFCDADDVVADDWAMAMYSALQIDDFVTGSLEARRLNSTARSISWTSEPAFKMPYMPSLVGASTNNMGLNRALFERLGGFCDDLMTNEDTDLSWRIQLAGGQLAVHPEIVLHIRKRAGRRAVLQQGYHYGVGDELLRARYANLIEALGSTPAVLAGDSEISSRAVGEGALAKSTRAVERAVRAVIRKRGRTNTVDRLHRFGHWIGVVRGRRLAGSVAKLPVPDPLPILGEHRSGP